MRVFGARHGRTACEETVFGEDCNGINEEYSNCGVLAVARGCGRGVHAVEEATETEEAHFGFTRDTASGGSVLLWRLAGRVWEKGASGAACQKDSCWIADALLDAKMPTDGDGENLARDFHIMC